jgi:hypothetical protein
MDLYAEAQAAAAPLNCVQEQFHFEVAEAMLRSPGINYSKEAYHAREVFDWVRRSRALESREHVVAVVGAPLATKNYVRAFGALEESRRIVAVSTHDVTNIGITLAQFIRYYLVSTCALCVDPAGKIPAGPPDRRPAGAPSHSRSVPRVRSRPSGRATF